MNHKFVERISAELNEIRTAGLYKSERIITSAQGPEIEVNGKKVLNFCANNYLGLSSHPKVMEAARKYVDHRGYGLSSVRFICGTQDIHKELEAKISKFLELRTRYYMLPLLTPTEAFSNLFSVNRMHHFR
jgi:glycine C-acetyltransferase